MTHFNPYSETLFRGQTFKERKRDMTIEQSRASAMAAFRAGRVAGHREAVVIITETMSGRSVDAIEALMRAGDAICALKDEPTNDRNLPRDQEAEEQAEKETVE